MTTRRSFIGATLAAIALAFVAFPLKLQKTESVSWRIGWDHRMALVNSCTAFPGFQSVSFHGIGNPVIQDGIIRYEHALVTVKYAIS